MGILQESCKTLNQRLLDLSLQGRVLGHCLSPGYSLCGARQPSAVRLGIHCRFLPLPSPISDRPLCPTAAAIHNSHGRCEERVARQAAEQLLPMVEVLLQPGLPGRITLAALAALQALFTRVGEQPELFTDVFALLNDPRILSAIIARIEGKATSDSGLDGVQSNWSPHWADSQLLSRVALDAGAPASLHDASTIGQEAIYALSCIVHPSPPPPSLFSFCLDPKVIISRIKIHIPLHPPAGQHTKAAARSCYPFPWEVVHGHAHPCPSAIGFASTKVGGLRIGWMKPAD